MKQYISFDKRIKIYKYNIKNNMLVVLDDLKKDVKKNRYYVNETAIEIIKLIDGTRSIEDIINLLSSKYNEKYEKIKDKIDKFLDDVQQTYKINIVYSNEPKPNKILFNKDNTMLPTVASIELTYRCNLRCLHCYGDYNSNYNVDMSKENALKLLHDLKEIGVVFVEFTGGDISVYPYLKDVLMEAIKLDFDRIGILTNSVILKDEIIDLIIANKDKTVVQIDLHSLDDKYLEWFTGKSNTLDTIKSNIIKMVNNDVITRIATMVTKRNLHELEKIADWLYSIGVKSSAMGPVIDLGRAKNNDVLLDDVESIKTFNNTIEKINNKYEKFISLIEDTNAFRPNCGSLTSNVTISPKGDIKHCTMDDLSYFNSSIGNVFEDNIKNIYIKNSEYINTLFSIVPPNSNLKECISCKYKFFCEKCLLRAFIKSKEIGDECKWSQSNIPQIVREKLQA